MRAVEDALGLPLFDRVGRNVQLTSEGEDLLRRSRQLLADADAIGERARALKGGDTGVLRVGATPQLIESLLVNVIAQQRRRHPGVEIHPVEDGGIRLLRRLDRGDIHLAITTERDDRFSARLVYPVYLLAALPKHHRLGRRAVLEITELVDEPLLLLAHGFGSRAWFHAACQIANIQPRVFFDSAAPQTLLALAAGGLGISAVSGGAQLPRAKGRVVLLTHPAATPGRRHTGARPPPPCLPPYPQPL